MRYYFSDECYWDSELGRAIYPDKRVGLPKNKRILLETLLEKNREVVTDEDLHKAIYGSRPANGIKNWRDNIVNMFRRDKANDKGLYARIPELESVCHRIEDRPLGFKIDIPEENIVFDSVDPIQLLDTYSDVWHSNKFWTRQIQETRTAGHNKLAGMAEEYLSGAGCSWDLIFASEEYAPVRRDVIDTLKDRASKGFGVTVLHGAGGEGKTTILMQLCAELYREGKTVLYHCGKPWEYNTPDNLKDCVFLIDAPAATFEFNRFLKKAVTEGFAVVFATRSNVWRELQRSLFDDVRRSIKEIEMPRVSLSEAKRFAKHLKKNIHGIKRTVKEVEELFYTDSYGFLYASMLMTIYNADSLEIIADQIIQSISKFESGKKALCILGAIVFAEQSNAPITENDFICLCREVEVDSRDVKDSLTKEVSFNRDGYRARHDIISKLFYRYLFGDYGKGIYGFFDEKEQGVIIEKVLKQVLDMFEESLEDIKPKDPRIQRAANLFAKAFGLITGMNEQKYLIQRIVESCRLHGLAAIDRTYHLLDNKEIRNGIAEKCYNYELPAWEIYRHWIKNMMSEGVEKESVVDILQHICMQMDSPANMWLMWAEVEETLGNIGAYDQPKTSAWIYKTIIEKFYNYESFFKYGEYWIKWSRFAGKYGCLNGGVQYTSEMLLRKACVEYKAESDVWSEWATKALDSGNYGDYQTFGSAAWILKEACTKHNAYGNPSVWLKWASFAKEHPLADNESKKITAAEILKMACLEHKISEPQTWAKWANEEVELGNIGDYSSVGSAAWIFKEGATNHNPHNDSYILLKWARFAKNHPVSDGEGNPITAKAILDFAKERCPSFHNPLWEELNLFKVEIGYN